MTTKTKKRVDINILKPVKSQFSKGWLQGVITSALDLALPDEGCQLGLAIADDDIIRHLNRDYRGLDEVTDVLAFSDSHPGHWEGEGDAPSGSAGEAAFIVPHPDARHLGEVVISYPQAVRQSEAGDSGLESEFALLIVHGVLHLLGFDHVEPDDQRVMEAKQREILSSIFPQVER